MKRTQIVLYTGASPNDVVLQALPLPVADAVAAQVTDIWVRPPNPDNPRSGLGAASVSIVLREGTTPPTDDVLFDLVAPARVVVALQNADVQMWQWDRFVGSAATTQAPQTMSASGTVGAGSVSAPVVSGGRARRRRPREWMIVRPVWPMAVPLVPEPLPAITGVASTRQAPQRMAARGEVSTEAHFQRDFATLLELVALDII